MHKLLFMIFSNWHSTDDNYFVYIFTGWLYCASRSSPVAQNEARQLLFLKATKFIAYTYYVSFS